MTPVLIPPTFDTKRFCPYHGEFIDLATCPVVATNQVWIARWLQRQQRRQEPTFESRPESAEPHLSAPDPLSTGRATLTSEVDEQERILLSRAPRRPPTGPKRRFERGPTAPALPSPAQLAKRMGGDRARPARACPVCLHPLPLSVDYRDPISVALVGHSQASKTTTMAALVDLANKGQDGPQALGLSEFSPTETTSRSMAATLRGYRNGGQTEGTPGGRFHPPLEFLTTANGQSSVLLLHDVAGEDLMHPDERLVWAPYVLWADAVVFVYNPEESPALGLKEAEMDQSTILNGVRDDIEGRPHTGIAPPPLIVAVSKSDLIADAPAPARATQEDVRRVLHGLGDADILTAAERWETVRWHLMCPQPPTGRPDGVIQVFRDTLSLVV